MIKKLTYLGIGLLSVTALTACSNEELTEHTSVSNPVLNSYSVCADLTVSGNMPGTRANVEDNGLKFFWNQGDEMTIWNGAEGFTFKAVDSYKEAPHLNKVEFEGQASLDDNQTVWGIYPKNETAQSEADVLSFNLPGTQTQTGNSSSLQNTMFMYATGSVSGNTIANMDFKHLTGIMHFKLTNNRKSAITIEHISVKANTAVFPYKASVGTDSEVTCSDERNEMKLTVNQTVDPSKDFNGFMSILPTANMTQDTELTFSAKLQGEDAEMELCKGKASELYGTETAFAKNGYKYAAGYSYGIIKTIQPAGGTDGYTDEGNSSYKVFSANGFVTLMGDIKITNNANAKITLAEDLNFEGQQINSISNFNCTLDGNSKKLMNFTLKPTDNKFGLIITNKGTISNLIIENTTLADIDATLAGLLVAENQGTISNCQFNGVSLSLKGSPTGVDAGLVVGKNLGGSAVIEAVSINGSSLTINSGKTNLGGIAGQNGNWNTPVIKGCSLNNNVTISCKDVANTSFIGGLVGWNCQGNIYGSSSNAVIKSNSSASYGGIVGANDYGIVNGSYCSGSFNVPTSGSRVSGGVAKCQQGKIVGCYSSVKIDNPTGKVGGLIGEHNGNIETCYVLNCTKSVGIGDGTGAEVLTDANSLIEKIETLNTAISSTGYQYTRNTAQSEQEPLVLTKK